MKNKYSDVGIALGTIADYMGENGCSPVEADFHKVFVRIIQILEDQNKEIQELRDELESLRKKGA